MKVALTFHKKSEVEFYMQVTTVGGLAITIGWIIAVVVLILAIIGLVGALPFTPTVVFGMFAALAIARLL